MSFLKRRLHLKNIHFCLYCIHISYTLIINTLILKNIFFVGESGEKVEMETYLCVNNQRRDLSDVRPDWRVWSKAGRQKPPQTSHATYGNLRQTYQEKLVLNRGFEKCLLLYPADVWAEKTKEVNQLNTYNAKKTCLRKVASIAARQRYCRMQMIAYCYLKSLMEHAGNWSRSNLAGVS